MVSYSVDGTKKSELLKYAKQFQGLVCGLANFTLTKKALPIKGIYKAEGGVTVNNKEIVIYSDMVRDDWSRKKESTKEETAVVSAIERIISEITNADNVVTGMTKVQKEIGLADEDFNMFLQNPFTGDPLRRFFEHNIG